MSEDRVYWHVPYARAWHADAPYIAVGHKGFCGRTDYILLGSGRRAETADRVPPNGHLCGSCARVIAARTDVETKGIEPWPDNPVAVYGGIAVPALTSEDGGSDYGNTLP